MPLWQTTGEVRAGIRLWYVRDMAHPAKAKGGRPKGRGAVPPSPPSRIPTNPPHPVPGGEYDRDGFLYECPVENLRHHHVIETLGSILGPHMRRRHGEAALVTGDVGFYARREDRTLPPFAADLLVSLTRRRPRCAGHAARGGPHVLQGCGRSRCLDLVLEVVSPSSRVRDTVAKPRRYEALRIPECWVFDPAGTAVPGGLRGRRLADDRYGDVPPSTPGQGEVPLPAGATAYWSAVLGLYLYADGKELRLHDPERGTLRNLEDTQRSLDEQTAARAAAEARAAALEIELEALRRRT